MKINMKVARKRNAKRPRSRVIACKIYRVKRVVAEEKEREREREFNPLIKKLHAQLARTSLPDDVSECFMRHQIRSITREQAPSSCALERKENQHQQGDSLANGPFRQD